MPGRLLAIGDIHGCDVALEVLLAAVNVGPQDTVVVLGDAVDRGPGSKNVVEQLIDLRSRCQLVFVLGNHEEMMLDALEGGEWHEGWLRYGGRETLASYGGSPEDIPAEHIRFLKTGLDYWEAEAHLLIHANLEPGVPLPLQNPEWLRWTHLTGFEPPHPSGKRVLCGHTPQRSGVPLVRPGWVGLDTFAWGSGWLTCLDTVTDEYYQANQLGQFRGGWLP